ncbi:MAG TPA: hypothetical protein VEI97_02425, partial [bacterium]|nr:hypothetical protein [bacterium]
MPRFLLSAPLLALAVVGCSQPSGPNTPTGQTSPIAPQTDSLAPTQIASLGRYSIEFESGYTTAQVEFEPPRGAAANDDLYWLPIGNFLRPTSFAVTGIARTASTLDVRYRFTHPFPAPSNPTGTPNGSTNRSDLGIAGQVVLLADVNTATGNTFFTDVVANTALVTNAAGYTRPEGLLNTGTTANTFPYQVLVDETGDGSRVGISNGGDPSGNFGSDGWTRAEYGPTNDGWTGFGVLHQGQSSEGLFSLDLATLQASPSAFSLDVEILAKYNDPRGGTNAAAKRANRLPADTPDPTRFAYRMPHGALDAERVTYLGESGGFLVGQVSGSTLMVEVVDWDARATPTAETDLANDLDVTTVYPAEVGAPTVEVSIPDVLGAGASALALMDADPSGDPEADSGRPDDPLYYEATVTAVTPPAAAGTYTGLVRAIDPEQGQVRDWQFFLDGDLMPVATPPEPVTYQELSVAVISANDPPSATVTVTSPSVASGGAVSISVSNIMDPEDPSVTLAFDWDDNGTVDFTTSPIPVPAGPLSFSSFTHGSMTFTHLPPPPDYRNLAVSISDGTNTVDVTPAVGPNGEHFTVLPPSGCPNPPKTGTDITAQFTDNITLTSANQAHPYAGTNGNHDTAAFRSTPYLGWFAYQLAGASTSRDIFRYPDTGAPGSAVRMTNMSALAGDPLNNQLVHQIEIDSTNRVFMALRPGSGTVSYPENVYPTTAARVDIPWFDYSGTTVTALGGTISTGSERVIAMALDAAGNVYMISHTHKLHRFEKAFGYTEFTGFPVDLVPIIGDPAITSPAANAWRVHDFVINWHNGSFYILTTNDATSLNGRLHRLFCDGTNAPGSPVVFELTNNTVGG